MSYYVRKITLSKFPREPQDNTTIEDINADAVADIRTFRNELSIWEIPTNSEEDIEEAVLALVTSAKQTTFERIDFVIIPEEELEKYGLELGEQPGDTAVEDLKETHKNITNLTFKSLRDILTIIVSITMGDKQIRKTKREVEEIVKKNVDRIDLQNFESDKVTQKIMSFSQ